MKNVTEGVSPLRIPWLLAGLLAVVLALPLHATPDPALLYKKGGALLKGKGVAKDPAKAARFFLAAAKQGHAPSMFMLGRLYLKGAGVEKSRPKATHWLEKARDAGYTKAAPILAKLQAKSAGGEEVSSGGQEAGTQGVKTREPRVPQASPPVELAGYRPTPQDRTNAESVRTSQKNLIPHLTEELLKTYRDAAAQGSPYHIFFMGYLHEEPNPVVKQDFAEARRLYREALAKHYELAKVFLYDLDQAGK